jgi:sulfoxide reductase heme-binding subunit YedZ
VSSNAALWYSTRASGIAAFVILTVVVCIGMSMGGKAQSRKWPKFSVEDIHRFGGLLVGALIGIHVATIALDSFLPFSVVNLLVPFTATYRPLWTGLGIAGAELLLALAVTNHYRKRLPYSFWRKAHYLNFAVWTLATLHGVMSGTDRSVWWLAMIYGLAIGSVVTILVWRFARLPMRSLGVALVAGATLVAVPLVIVGPLYHAPPVWDPKNISETLTGRVIQNGTNLTQIVSFVGQAKQPQKLFIRADLLMETQQLRNTSFQVEYLASGDVCRGTIANIPFEGTGFGGTCRMPNGQTRTVGVSWRPTRAGKSVIGQIQLSG